MQSRNEYMDKLFEAENKNIKLKEQLRVQEIEKERLQEQLKEREKDIKHLDLQFKVVNHTARMEMKKIAH